MNKPSDPFADMPDEWKEEVQGAKAFNKNEPRNPDAGAAWLKGWDNARQSHVWELRLSTMAMNLAMHSTFDYKQARVVMHAALVEWDGKLARLPADRKSAV